MSLLIESASYSSSISDFSMHTHTCYEIIFLFRGSLSVTIGGVKYDAVGPSLIFISKLESHSITVHGNVYERYYLCISPAMAGNMIRNYTLLTLLSNRPSNFCHVLEISTWEEDAQRIFRGILAETDFLLPFSSELQASLLNELLIRIYRQRPSLFSPENEKSVSVIWQIQCQLEQNCQEAITLDELANTYHMSSYYLSHLFKKITGYSILQYLIMCRLSAARRFLLETEKTVTEIVFDTGFSDSSNFSRLFKREMGCSPLEYRRRSRRKETL